jgi:hypothetical protein
MPDYRPSDYRNPEPMREPGESLADRTRRTAHDATERVETMVGELAEVVRQRPYATVAMAAGLAFAVGALWKLGHRRPPSRLQTLLDRLPELPNRSELVPRRWR